MVRSRPRGPGVSLNAAVADAYAATGAAWQRGPGLVYDRLADLLVSASPVALSRSSVLDLGAGTGAVSRAARLRGADVVAVDIAMPMLAADADERPSGVAGDALALPFRRDAFDVVAAAFSLNHLVDPVAGLHEAARVTRPGGAVLASAYALDDSHPVKQATQAAAEARGWSPAPWIAAVSEHAVPRLATVDRAGAAATAAGLDDVLVTHLRVPFPELGPADLVAWRLGMAQLAPFVASLTAAESASLAADAIERLGGAPVLERSVIVLSGRVR